MIRIARARVEIRQRNRQQAEQQHGNRQRHAPHQLGLVLRVAAADKLRGGNGAAVVNRVHHFGRGVDDEVELLKRHLVKIAAPRDAAVTIAIGEHQRALVARQIKMPFFGKHHAIAPRFVYIADKQVLHDAAIGVKRFHKIHAPVFFAQLAKRARLHQRQVLLLLQQFSVFAAAVFRPRQHGNLHRRHQ